MANSVEEIALKTQTTDELSCSASFKQKAVRLIADSQNFCVRFCGNAREQKQNFVIPLDEIICIRKGTSITVFDANHNRFDAVEVFFAEDNENDLNILAVYTIKKQRRNKWCLRYHLFDVKNDAEAAKNLARHILRALSGFQRPKSLLVFVNPYGGKKRAGKIYDNYARPLFSLAKITPTVIVTERANHAHEYVLENDLKSFDGIISVGGDGLFNEILHALILRFQHNPDDVNSYHSRLVSVPLKIGLIPAGSTNALCFSINGNQNPLTSVLHIILGDRIGVDVCSVLSAGKLLKFACTAVSYGFLGDVLKHSETLRSFGPIRYSLAGLKMIFRHPIYKGTVEYHTVSPENDGNHMTKCKSRCNICENKETYFENNSPSTTSASAKTEEPPPVAPADQWVKVENTFLHICGAITPCICKLAPVGLSPTCHLGDGTLDLVLVGRISRIQNAVFIARVMSNQENHLEAPFVRVSRVKAFRFTPDQSQRPEEKAPTGAESPRTLKKLEKASAKFGVWNIDGELLTQTASTFHFRVHRQLITMFSRGLEQ